MDWTEQEKADFEEFLNSPLSDEDREIINETLVEIEKSEVAEQETK